MRRTPRMSLSSVTIVSLVLGVSAATSAAPRDDPGSAIRPLLDTPAPGAVLAFGSDVGDDLGNGVGGSDGCTPEAPCVEVPTPLGLIDAVDVATRGDTTVVAMADGTVRTWGEEVAGMGTGAVVDAAPAPLAVADITDAVAVATTGPGASYALLRDGTVMAWGEGGYGSLGYGDGPVPCPEGETGCDLRPVAVIGLTDVVALAGGRAFLGMALRGDGSVWAWGYDDFGAVGDGDAPIEGCQGPGGGGGVGRCQPSPVAVGGIDEAVAIDAEGSHAIAALGDGSVVMWGEGNVVAGDGTDPAVERCDGGTPCVLAPIVVPGVSGAIDVATGVGHALALTADGDVYAWGDTNRGALGIGEDGSDTCVTTEDVSYACQYRPVKVSGLEDVVAVHAGGYRSFAVHADGTVSGWGSAVDGGLGVTGVPFEDCLRKDGETEECARAPIAIPGLSGVVDVATGTGQGSRTFAIAATCDDQIATVDGLTGTDDDDVLVGTALDDVVDGGGGDDVVCGLDGTDAISGGDGVDTIFGGAGDDAIEGDGADTIDGGGGDDTCVPPEAARTACEGPTPPPSPTTSPTATGPSSSEPTDTTPTVGSSAAPAAPSRTLPFLAGALVLAMAGVAGVIVLRRRRDDESE